jgi:LysR family transcriptional activator of nhaA
MFPHARFEALEAAPIRRRMQTPPAPPALDGASVRHINYTYLLYFWTVQREGSVSRAAEVLNLTPQTISGQIKRLEESIGVALFQRDGRSLVLTDTGRLVAQFADEIFTVGQELTQILRHGAKPRSPRSVSVGIVNSIAKLIACEIVAPAMALEAPVRVVTHEDTLEELLADMSVHRLDMVLSDRSLPSELNVRAYSRTLGQSDMAFFAHPDLAEGLGNDFPACLDGAPFLMPAARNTLRARLEVWCADQGVRPVIAAEIDDSGLLKAFGQQGLGVFVAPAAISSRVCDSYGVIEVGRTARLVERYYAILPERRVAHPAVVAITEAGQQHLDPAQ